MSRVGLILISIVVVLMIGGCGKEGDKSEFSKNNTEVIQQSNGNILLDIGDAYLLSDADHPTRNTAEWRFEVLSKGRYEVWLSSHTQDTMNLDYKEPVIVTFENKRISEKPVGDEIVLDDNNVDKPYYRADSKLGSIYIEDAGHYNIQVISEKLLAKHSDRFSGTTSPQTFVKSLILKPLMP